MLKSVTRVVKSLFTSEQKKINFLQKKIYDYYYTQYSILYNANNPQEVNIPSFLIIPQVRELAMKDTKIQLERVIKQCKVNKYYLEALK